MDIQLLSSNTHITWNGNVVGRIQSAKMSTDLQNTLWAIEVDQYNPETNQNNTFKWIVRDIIKGQATFDIQVLVPGEDQIPWPWTKDDYPGRDTGDN